MKPPIIHYTAFSDEEFEGQLSSKHAEIYKSAETLGRESGRNNQPPLKAGILSVHIGKIEALYNEIQSRINGRLQPKTAEIEMQGLANRADEKIKTLGKTKLKNETELFNFENDLRHNGIAIEDLSKIILSPNAKKGYLAFAIIGLSEWFFTATGLEGIGHNFLIALIIAGGITVALFFLAQYVGKHLKEFGKGKAKTIVTIGACLLAVSVFIGLAVLRVKFINEQEDISISPLFLVLFNVLFFCVTLWFFYNKSQTPEAEKKQEQLSHYKEKWEGLNAKLAEIDTEIETIKEDLAQRSNLLLHKPGYAKNLNERIEHWRAESIAGFIASNIASRPDQGVPDCFINATNSKKNV